jgi:ACS family tartrate transporter-like MFS transporter
MGIGGGIFLLGYFLLEIPGELIAEHWSARRWIPRIMVSWGILTVVMAFIHTAPEFYFVRFLVDALEAAFVPAVIVYLTHWLRTTDCAKTVAGSMRDALSYVMASPLPASRSDCPGWA